MRNIRNRIRAAAALLAILLVLLFRPGACADVYLNKEKPADWEQRDLLRITALSFIQNDAFVLECGGKTMLIDGGSGLRWKDLTQYLQDHDLLHVDIIFNTHPHDDHLEAVLYTVRNSGLTADEFISPFEADYVCKNDLQRKMAALLQEKGIPFRQMFSGEELTLGEARMVLYQAEKGDANARSGVLRIRFGDASILLTADISGQAQKEILAAYGEEGLKADILKAPHHGIVRMVPAFLDAVAPEFGIVTGRKNSKAQEQFDYRKIPNIWTSLGDAVMETDGTDWYITQENKWAKK